MISNSTPSPPTTPTRPTCTLVSLTTDVSHLQVSITSPNRGEYYTSFLCMLSAGKKKRKRNKLLKTKKTVIKKNEMGGQEIADKWLSLSMCSNVYSSTASMHMQACTDKTVCTNLQFIYVRKHNSKSHKMYS